MASFQWPPQGSASGSGIAIGDPVTGGTDKDILFVHPSGVLAQDSGLQYTLSSQILGLVNLPTVSSLVTAGILHNSSAGVLSSSLIVNADVDAAAAIAGSKLQAATLTNAGAVTTSAQTFGGAKTFSSVISQSTISAATSISASTSITAGTQFNGSGAGLTSIPAAQLSGVVPIANGGTNNSSGFPAKDVIFSSGTALITDSNIQFDTATNRFALGNGGNTMYNQFQVGVPSTSDSLADGFIAASATTQKPLVLQGKASQAASLQEWQNNSGTALASVSAAGNIAATNLSGTNTGNVTLAAVGASPNANGASLSGQALTLQPANTSNPGVLTSTDWNTFNGKQAAGNYITSLTTDVVASGAGAAAATIQTNVVTNAKLAQAATLTLKGNNTGGTANVADLTVAQVNTMLGTFANPMTTGGDIIYGGASGVATRLANGTAGQYLQSSGTTVAPTWKTFTAPTVQKFTSGSGTYTLPANVLYIRVVALGGGGGGERGGTTGGSDQADGGNTTFGSSLIVANGGKKGVNTNGGLGGTGSLGTGPVGVAVSGSGGDPGGAPTATVYTGGGSGGTSPMGGAGGGGSSSNGISASANSGSGGGGGGQNGGVSHNSGGGGGAGGYVNGLITSPSATYAYAIGAAGSGASGGDFSGGNGAAGVIVVEEFYS